MESRGPGFFRSSGCSNTKTPPPNHRVEDFRRMEGLGTWVRKPTSGPVLGWLVT